MAAPTPTARQDPAGIRLEDGYRTLVTFASIPTASLWEISITPPGMDGGDPVDTTTMHNDDYRTMAPRALITLTEFTFTAAYDPNFYNQLLTIVNVETTVTVTFPDGSTLAFFGFLQKIEPEELVEGTMPTVSVTVCPTNTDSTGAEQPPVLTSVAGT
jgi:hypothetical protein